MKRKNDPPDNGNVKVIPIELKRKLYSNLNAKANSITSQNENNVPKPIKPKKLELKIRTKIIRGVLGDCTDIEMSAKSTREPVMRSTTRADVSDAYSQDVKTNKSLYGKRNESNLK